MKRKEEEKEEQIGEYENKGYENCRTKSKWQREVEENGRWNLRLQRSWWKEEEELVFDKYLVRLVQKRNQTKLKNLTKKMQNYMSGN